MPNGLACCPGIFTQILKPVFSAMVRKGHVMFPYIDDFHHGSDSLSIQIAVNDLCNMFTKLGFYIHNSNKSVLTPTTMLKFLGIFIDTNLMTINLTDDTIDKLITTATQLTQLCRPKIRQVVVLVGIMFMPLPYYVAKRTLSL